MARPLTPSQIEAALGCLPLDRPFTYREGVDLGINDRLLRRLVDDGLVQRPVQGVYCVVGLADTLDSRIRCLALVVPADCVVTDLTASWIWVGDRALPPGGHLVVPPVSVFAPPGRRLRNGLVDSGERRLGDGDVVEVGGLLVTSPLRTTCDVGRLLHADSALAAMDSLATTGSFVVDQLVEELDRFRGYRGVVQARAWAPYVDAGSDSWLESVGRKRWVEATLPRPTTQCPVPGPDGGWFYVDFGLPEERFGVEVFGEEFHGPRHEAHDGHRLLWLREAQDWNLLVARNRHITGRQQDLEVRLRLEWHRHRNR